MSCYSKQDQLYAAMREAMREAADALEAQAKRLAELESRLAQAEVDAAKRRRRKNQMVKRGGMETSAGSVIETLATSNADSTVCYFDWSARIKHPKFGMVSVRSGTVDCVDTSKSVKEWEADFSAFVERCVKGIEAAASQEREA